MRNVGLDILRGIAILLVLFRHGNVDFIFQKFGWLGVDLFFVISGYLITLKFLTEFKATRDLNFKKHFFKRAIKILPPYYVFVFGSLLIIWLTKGPNSIDNINLISEIFFVQNYIGNIWTHTWSLAVEVHFYLLIPVFISLLINRNNEESKSVIYLLLSCLILSFGLRFFESYPYLNKNLHYFMQSHLRIDGFLVGTLCAYLVLNTNLKQRVLGHKFYYLIVSFILISPGIILVGGDFYMNTFGLTSVNLGFGLWVLILVDVKKKSDRNLLVKILFTYLPFVGKSSYSIYLWHLTCKMITSYINVNSNILKLIIYLIISIGFGSIMYVIIEKPLIKLKYRCLQHNFQ